MFVGGNAVQTKTEADSKDMTECPHDDTPTTGMLFWFHTVFKTDFILFALTRWGIITGPLALNGIT